MQTIERPFNPEDLSQLENLTAVAGYLRNEPFEIETYESGQIPEPVLIYLQNLKEENELGAEPNMSNAVVDLLNQLLLNKKYQDPIYIQILQNWLQALTYKLPLSEYQNKQYGNGTTSAVQSFQEAQQLSTTGTIDVATEQALQQAYAALAFVVKGTAHDANWIGINNASIEVWEKALRGTGTFLQGGNTDDEGSYAIAYHPPIDNETGLFVDDVHLIVRIKDGEGSLLLEEVVYHAASVTWVNYTAGDRPYQGKDVYTVISEQLTPYLEGIGMHQIEESDQNQDATYLYQKTGVPIQTILQLYFAKRVAFELEGIPASVLFAFFQQQLPSILPSYLLPDEPSEWSNWSDNLSNVLTDSIPLMPAELQERALDRAIQNNLIPLADQQNKAAILQRLDELRLEYAKNKPLIAGKLSLNDLVKQTGISDSTKDNLAAQFAQNQQLNAVTIQQWYEDALLNKDEHQQLQQELQLAALSLYDKTVIQKLRDNYDTEEFSAFVYQVSDFAKWTQQDWDKLGYNSDGLTGDFVQRAAALAPTVAVIAALQRDGNHGLEHLNDLATLVDNQQLLSLGSVPIDTYLQEQAIELPAAVVDELKLIQRVEHLAPRPDLVPALLGANIHSAYQVHRLGKTQLTEIYTQAGMDAPLAEIHARRTVNTAANTLSTLTGLSAHYGLLDGGGITPASITPLPNLEDLFGNNDFCGCVHCRSVYSPAAYLTDLLHWLKSKSGKIAGKSALELILERRPDLEHILLNCKNATTPMPYIDLVCEVLEYAILPTTSYEKRNTTWQAAELKARSEHRLDAVYERLALLPDNADYRPYASYDGFNIWQTQVHLFIEKLGITSSQFVQLLGNANIGYLEQGAATFELPSHEAIAITTPHADVEQLTTPNRNVAVLLHDHQLSYEQLLMLLEGAYTNPNKKLSIEPEESCDLDELLVADMTAVELDRWWRFLRLWKYTDWSIWELDALIMHPKVGSGTLNSFTLERLATFQRLQKRLGKKAHEVLGMMGSLDASNRANKSGDLVPSFYESIFYHRLLDESQRAFFDKDNLTLNLSLGTITAEQIAYIAAALSMTSSQVETLLFFPQQGQWAQLLPQRVHQMSSAQEGLGLLYAYANLAKHLRLSVEELRGYLRLLINIANPLAGLDKFNEFLDHYETLRASGLQLDELLFLLAGNDLEDFQPSQTQVHQWQDDLFKEVAAAYDNAMISKQTEAATIQGLLRQTGTFETEEAILTFSEVLYQTTDGVFTGSWSNTDRTDYLNTILPTLFGYADAAALDQLKDDIINNRSSAAAVATLKVIIHRRLHSNVVINYLADLWDAPTDVLAYLLGDNHPTLGKATRHRLMEQPPVGNAITTHALASVPTGSTPVVPPSFTNIYSRLLKYVFLAKAWQLNGADLEQMELAAAVLPSLNVSTLPLNNTGAASTHTAISGVTDYLNTAQWMRIAQQYNISVAALMESIITLEATSNTTIFLAEIAELTGWNAADLATLEQHFQWTTTDYTTQLGHWKHWNLTVQLVHQLQVSAAEALGWLSLYDTSTPNYFNQQKLVAQQVQNAVREAAQPDQWLLLQQEVQDQIRLQKRNALVGYVRNSNYDNQGNRVYYSTNDLYHVHLIDPQMSACQMTSRIKQAISAVQLYVQRCRLGLEQDHIQVTEDQGWEEWKWMQYYRVWEANRKVFLYPENWIEPGLRDNKSELFQQFEEEVLQQEVTQENVEVALQNYLERLNEISNLEMMSIARGIEKGVNVTHVLARTKEHPSVYYYRKIDDDSMEWTSWEKVPFDVQGEHPVLQMYNDTLHLFWLQILEQPEELVVARGASDFTSKDGAQASGNNAAANTSVKSSSRKLPATKMIQLAWSTMKTTGWSEQQLSKRKLIHPWPRPDYSLHLRPRRHINSDLWIDLYVSTSPEFNNNPFYNQFSDTYERMAKVAYNPSYESWHSSSFVFDGTVRQVKLFAIDGKYWVKELIGVVNNISTYGWDITKPLWIDSIVGNNPTNTSDITYVTSRGNFKSSDELEMDQFARFIDNQNVRNFVSRNAQALEVNKIIGIENYNNLIKINFEIEVPPHHNLGTINSNISSVTFSKSLTEWNNILAHDNNPTIADRPWIELSTRQVTSQTQFTENYQREDSDSYLYVYHNYGQDGRQIEELYPQEQAALLPLPVDHVYKYNKIVLNSGSSNNTFQLNNTPSINLNDRFQVVIPMEHTYYQHEMGNYFTIQVHNHSFFFAQSSRRTGYRMYHPFSRAIQGTLGRDGVQGLYNRSLQLKEGNTISPFPNSNSIPQGQLDSPVEDINFKLSDGYGVYNWEVFFHIPFLIATELSKNQRFEEAMAWFHCIFNPLGIDEAAGSPSPASAASRYWITKPFYEHNQNDYWTQQIQNMLNGMLSTTTQNAIRKWKNNPFQPHVIARMRPVAYQKAVVMKYIDNLLAWGDQLFRQETLESINQAGLMYVLAAELLGDRPKELKGKTPVDLDYNEIKSKLNKYFSNAHVGENSVISTGQVGIYKPNGSSTQLYSLPNNAQYFCIPHNEKLSGYWDLVADRLFKIRHCMDIDGRIRQLPLFAPPIDPALLVNAVANGVDLSSIVQDLNAFPPHYKYRPLVRLATQFCSEVKSLGQSFLSALQSRDAEGMALLQSGNALKVLDATTGLKQLQIEEAQENIRSLELSKDAALFRQNFYVNRKYMSGGEKAAQTLIGTSIRLDRASMATQLIGSILVNIPKVEAGMSGPLPITVAEIISGAKLAAALSMISTVTAQASGIKSKTANIVGTKASYDRRQEEWDFQAELATRDIEQIDQQIAAAQIRVAMAEKDLKVHQQQIDNTEMQLAYLQSKYTNQQLYSWMVGQLSKIYREAYDLAFDLAKRAEKSLNYELGLPLATPRVIQHGYWDSLRKGLLAGDKLMLAINHLEDKYVQLNKRELELTKHISLHQWAPEALLQLKTTGNCQLNIPEWWFDIDYPGHYLRRIKALTISIPCIVGPNTNVNCTVNLSRHSLRRESIVKGAGYMDEQNLDQRYDSYSIATSSGQNDAGVFEMNFNDERFLPFEGLGAISTWDLSLPDYAQFDYKSITDVVFHLRYTARDAGKLVADAAKAHVLQQLTTAASQEPPSILVSAREAFPTAWHQFKHQPTDAVDANSNPISIHDLVINIKQQHYPYFTSLLGTPETIGGMVGIVRKADYNSIGVVNLNISATNLTSYTPSVTIDADTRYGAHDLGVLSDPGDAWTIQVNSDTEAEAIEDIYLLLVYKTT